MRNALGSFGAIGGAVVVTMAALYGFTTSDTAINGVVVGFFFAIIALGGVAGPAAVVHDLNGFRLAEVSGKNLAECAENLANQACAIYPTSDFAQRYKAAVPAS